MASSGRWPCPQPQARQYPMRRDPLPPLQSEAALPGLPFDRIDALLRHEAEAHGLPLHSGHGRSTWCVVDGGEIGARMAPEGSVLYVRAHNDDWLFSLQEAMTSHLSEADPALAALLRWSGRPQAGALPPNFSFARVESLNPVGRHFLRLRLRGDTLDRFARDAIHFRLVLPPSGQQIRNGPAPARTGRPPGPRATWPCTAPPIQCARSTPPRAGWIPISSSMRAGWPANGSRRPRPARRSG